MLFLTFVLSVGSFAQTQTSLLPRQIALIINTDNPDSRAIAEYYCLKRRDLIIQQLDERFGQLKRLTADFNRLVECYYRTKPLNSWRLTLIGDPLYQSRFAQNLACKPIKR